MDLFKFKTRRRRLTKSNKPNPDDDDDTLPHVPPQYPPTHPHHHQSADSLHIHTATATATTTQSEDDDDDDDDDFILSEVKRKLKELRRNSFMVLIPEESSCPEGGGGEEGEQDEEEEEDETSCNDWRDVEAEGRQLWSAFDAFYDIYCQRMLFFDHLNAQHLNEISSYDLSTQSPRTVSKKLTSPLRCLYLRKDEKADDETEQLQQPENDPHQDLEMAYVAQMCLSWEALHCQYIQLSQKISCQPGSPACYNNSMQQFQQFEVLLQRFIENEPFEKGLRPEIYARTRFSMPKLLQVPNIKGSGKRESMEESDLLVLARDLLKVIESSILTFHLFLKTDRKKSGARKFFGVHNQMATPLQQIQFSLEKREMKLRELRKRRKSGKCWPASEEEMDLLLGLTDVKVIARVLRMARINKEQLFWCEEKMKRLDFSSGKLQRDPSPVHFPC